MAEVGRIQGELQAQIMDVVWRLGAASVEDVRSALPPRHRGAYTTVQTVLNRLADRGLLSRRRQGQRIVYRARFSEADYLSRSIQRSLASASPDARHVALARLIGRLDRDELSELRRLAAEIERRRSGTGS